MASPGRKRARLKILNEVKNQLVLQAERWGKAGYYTPLKLEEMEEEQCGLILSDLLSERANLEYEIYLFDVDKKELLIKLEKLQGYLKRAERVIKKHEKSIRRQLEKLMTEKDRLKLILKKLKPENTISVLLSSN